ncbi:MAG: histidine kinase [Opitutales bacterium]|nr:histidine kinase [Opitutales bacterium]
MKDIQSIIPYSLRFGKSYACKSAGVWLCIAALFTVMDYMVGRHDLGEEILSNLILVGSCAVGTHLIRMLIRSSPEASWKSINIQAFAIGVPLFSLLMSIFVIECTAILTPERVAQSSRTVYKMLFGLWFFEATLFIGWTGVYVSTMAIKKSSQMELERLRLETALREAELRALKAQINPHFLFNSLNTIRALVNERPERAQEAVLHLSLLLRVALQNENQLRSLREELDTVSHYLELERLRFEERLKVTINVSAEAMEQMIPTMLIQTLVENAVKHGIGRSVSGGELCIRASIDNNSFVLQISNPGTLKSDTCGTGLGLNNARMRLVRLLGADAVLSLYEKDSLVIAEINIPVKKDDRSTAGR